MRKTVDEPRSPPRPEDTPMTSLDVRSRILEALRLDLVGPSPEDEGLADEVLPTTPSRWYLNGFLVPYEAAGHTRLDDAGSELLDLTARQGAGDDEATPDGTSARPSFFPSSMGLSVLVFGETKALEAEVTWGDYATEVPKDEDVSGGDTDAAASRGDWRRTARKAIITVPVEKEKAELALPGHPGVKIVVTSRPVVGTAVKPGSRSVSVFVVNKRQQTGDMVKERAWMFQVQLRLTGALPFEARPDVRGRDGRDPDEQIADLQYRDAFEYAVGHNVAAHVEGPRSVRTTWIPVADVEKVVPRELDGVELKMEALARLTSAAEISQALDKLVTDYTAWIQGQLNDSSKLVDPDHVKLSADLMRRAGTACRRIRDGIELLGKDPLALEAFRVANAAVAVALRQRWTHDEPDKRKPEEAKAPEWRPFQLAFILMNLVGITQPTHKDREFVDLLFFPTGGGKTEAYLGLAAYTLILRRLQNPGLGGAGVSVLMRYTLRLLTLDQLGRAATLLCALEQRRQEDVQKFGPWPFEIGLWVGQSATPNRLGRKGDKDEHSARARTIAFQTDDRKNPAPIPIENCPWCGRKFDRRSFVLLPDADRPNQLRIRCSERDCRYKREDLPILSVDDNIYQRLPAFLIATVDKFAALPWVGDTGALFGRVERADSRGFYGPMNLSFGELLAGPLPPPDLVIQDELHLISGPLGTMVGLYEAAIDHLSTREVDGQRVRPKVVASTATVRRASSQIRALFGRDGVDVFPPPGPDRRDSFFAITKPTTEKNPRIYVGIAAPGRSLKVVLLRASLAVMGAAQRAWADAGGDKAVDNPADPYMTLLGYFNSLRELGGSRRIVEDEVTAQLRAMGDSRRRVGNPAKPFANRSIGEPLELTSRVSTSKVAEAKRRLAVAFPEKEQVDYALATNMISVGLDITRLGLMVVLGQPKMTAEYIQATSRVGRDDRKPGLVITLLNVHRPRDRSHYERFEAWHETFYRQVEATSVTPFSPRALDRGLAAVTVALARLGDRELTAPPRAGQMPMHHTRVEWVADVLSRRAEKHDDTLDGPEQEALRQKVKLRTKDLLDTWDQLATSKHGVLQYQKEVGEAPPLLFMPLDPELMKQPREARKFKASRSLRDVEPTVNLWVKRPDGLDLEEEKS